jgi:hypothetical protein
MNLRKRKAQILARAALKSYFSGDCFRPAYWRTAEGKRITDAVEEAIKRDVWWRRLLRLNK